MCLVQFEETFLVPSVHMVTFDKLIDVEFFFLELLTTGYINRRQRRIVVSKSNHPSDPLMIPVMCYLGNIVAEMVVDLCDDIPTKEHFVGVIDPTDSFSQYLKKLKADHPESPGLFFNPLVNCITSIGDNTSASDQKLVSNALEVRAVMLSLRQIVN